MQETILALGALMIIMLIAINQQRSTIHMHEQAYVREISQARDDFATSLLEGIVNQMSFDENTIGAASLPVDPTTMTAALGLEPGDTSFDDLDDFHTHRDTFLHVISADTFRFDVRFTVIYKTASDGLSAVPTFTKEITAQVDPIDNFGKYEKTLSGQFSKTMIVSDSF